MDEIEPPNKPPFAEVPKRLASKARPQDMLPFLDRAKREAPPVGDEV